MAEQGRRLVLPRQYYGLQRSIVGSGVSRMISPTMLVVLGMGRDVQVDGYRDVNHSVLTSS